MPLSIEVIATEAISPAVLEEVRDLCTDAYAEDFSSYLRLVGPGVHVVGRLNDGIVTHAMWVTRWLQPGGRVPLRTAYVEAVATRPADQGRGFATRLLARLADEIRAYELGALSPSVPPFYAGLGWETWRGPLFVRTDAGLVATPEDQVMVLRLPGTPSDLDLDAPLSAEWRRGELW